MDRLEIRVKQYNQAKELAQYAHREQLYGDNPYYFHLSNVEEILRIVGASLEDDFSYPILIAAWLHDVLEDTAVTLDSLRAVFDNEIIDIVWNVTDAPCVSRRQKKLATYQKIKLDERSLILKLADRLANVQFSLVNNLRFFRMYQREQAEFAKHLKPMMTHPMTIKLWRMLDDIIQQELEDS